MDARIKVESKNIHKCTITYIYEYGQHTFYFIQLFLKSVKRRKYTRMHLYNFLRLH